MQHQAALVTSQMDQVSSWYLYTSNVNMKQGWLNIILQDMEKELAQLDLELEESEAPSQIR